MRELNLTEGMSSSSEIKTSPLTAIHSASVRRTFERITKYLDNEEDKKDLEHLIKEGKSFKKINEIFKERKNNEKP